MNDFSKRRLRWMLIGWTLLRLIFNFGPVDLWAAQSEQIERDLSRKKKENFGKLTRKFTRRR
jgi:hypothetical protein